MSATKTGIVFILRGLPGVGKTTIANQILTQINQDSLILSSDDFFKTGEVHSFDKEKIKDAHEWNFDRYKKAIESRSPVIIVDNSNIKSFHYHHYMDYGQRHDYLVVIVTIPHNDVDDTRLADRNIHGVSRETIRRMRKEFEWEIK